METTTTMQGTTTVEYRLNTEVELKSENNLADYYFLTYEVKVLGKWTLYDGIGAYDFNDDLDQVTKTLADKAKERWGVIYG